MIKSVKFSGRTLTLSPLVTLNTPLPGEGYLVLLPAFSESENTKSLEVARFYIGSRCKELCCVGASATKLEEQIDAILEDAGLFIPTTAVLNADEACDYFLFGADAGVARYLFAPVEEHDYLAERLVTMVQSR